MRIIEFVMIILSQRVAPMHAASLRYSLVKFQEEIGYEPTVHPTVGICCCSSSGTIKDPVSALMAGWGRSSVKYLIFLQLEAGAVLSIQALSAFGQGSGIVHCAIGPSPTTQIQQLDHIGAMQIMCLPLL
jgi:hypothetical protein